ncbi:glutamyl-tRNA(Gln) amidotransferase, B subunit [Thermodesulfatator indicus DSM 15286]|uniref:Aspartyl/glutamyl-tRNA(Asn/Gln) amidotransferase subunit B n=1 Tax=Thermodesulfatator indicus (strain DSM 15286 / JCM 11887 / CIR29812) TaxID=667014 RepID=F8A956_THEID|nr:Asp-tRNA(Asn)/Glu-tRNA(Gln) amidotransferase subunit GatB [Thermodesulfatator indicus]AEH45187.1 glutamyl-tRNA(Gln) amidotransferase, B subunit [Thermodesulfatator indicus DSM 15286]
MDFEAVIGLEVHAQLLTKSKIFCTCSTEFGAAPNSHVCPVCCGMPGTLPVLNKRVVDFAIKLALATNARINPVSVFARKNYFYPDLPKGYQISQYELPLAEGGYIEIEVNGSKKKIGLVRIHMEEDAGKLIHDETRPVSYVDLNRTGVPLLEIVSEPDMRSPEEAVAYLKKLRSILRYLEICDGNMEEGSLRCDANISVRPKGSDTFGTKVELKNMNSFKHVQKALEYEIKRQIALILDGKEVVQETRLFDVSRGITQSMRGKEEAHDYRYFPDPDLVPIEITESWIEEIAETLPELPDAKKERFIKEYNLPEYDAEIITSSRKLAEFYEACVKAFPKPKLVSNWIMTEVLRELNKEGKEIDETALTPENFVKLLKLLDEGVISSPVAKKIFPEVYKGADPQKIVEEKGLKQESDEAALEAICQKILEANPKEVEKYRQGKKNVIGFFVGQVMRETKGKANPKVVNQILTRLLEQ